MSSPAVEDSAGWRLPRHELAHGLLLTGIGLALYGFFTVGYPRVIVPMICAVIGAVLVERGIQLLRTHRVWGSESSPQLGIPSFLLHHGELHPQVKRLLTLLDPEAGPPGDRQWRQAVTPMWDAFKIDPETNALLAFTLHTKTGYFADDVRKRQATPTLENALESQIGPWTVSFDVANDRIHVSQLGSGEVHPVANNPDAARIIDVVAAEWKGKLTPIYGDFSVEDGVLVSYAFGTAEQGFLTNEQVQNQINDKLTKVISPRKGCTWEVAFDESTDRVEVTQASSLPSMASPMPEDVVAPVASVAEARSRYPQFEFVVGEGVNGKKIGFKPIDFAHIGIFGTSGGGKSVLTRGIVEQFRAAGFMFYICDGKGADYTQLEAAPGIVARADTPETFVAVVGLVRRLVDTRMKKLDQLARQGHPDRLGTLTPTFLILDEFASIRDDIKDKYDAKGMEQFDDDLSRILRKGREARVHVLLVTQDMYKSSLPGPWLKNITVRLTLGRPDRVMIENVFPQTVRGQARRKAGSIPEGVKGRGMVSLTDEETGESRVDVVQFYWCYSPADPKPIEEQDSNTQKIWSAFKERVSDRIPKLYPRVWIKPEYPEPRTVNGKVEKDPYVEQRAELAETGLVKMQDLTVSDLRRLSVVPLEEAKDGVFLPINDIYDPHSDHYIARDDLGSDDRMEFV